MDPQEPRHFCVKFDPSCESALLLALSNRGRITADRCRTVFWAELPAATECELERLRGGLKAIEYAQPLWADVLREQEPDYLGGDGI